MANVIRTVIMFRRATTAEWLANKDVIPAAGEPCFDLDLHTLKIGDGKATYENLPTIGGVDVSADGKSLVLENNTFKLFGFDAAEAGAQPRKNADGELEWVVPSSETLEGLQTIVAGLQTDVSNIKEILTPSGEGETALADRVAALEGKVDGTGEGSVDQKITDEVTSQINDFATKVSDDGVVNTMKELVDYVATHGPEAANMAANITTLQELVGSTSVSDQISAAMNGIESGAQVNKIESVKLGENTLEIVEKTVTVPVGAGLVASDEVTIGTDGALGIGQVDISKLVQTPGTEFILDGGGAA